MTPTSAMMCQNPPFLPALQCSKNETFHFKTVPDFFPEIVTYGVMSFDFTVWHCDVMWRHSMTSWCQVMLQYENEGSVLPAPFKIPQCSLPIFFIFFFILFHLFCFNDNFSLVPEYTDLFIPSTQQIEGFFPKDVDNTGYEKILESSGFGRLCMTKLRQRAILD